MEQRKSISLQDLDDRLGNVENSLRDILGEW